MNHAASSIVTWIAWSECSNDVAAPILLHLPYHHCAYDLFPQVPEAVIAIVLFLLGTFCAGWAGVAATWGRSRESVLFVPPCVEAVLQIGCFGYLGSLTITLIALALAAT